jgi:NAD(P)-dependent dehydrogenase (short-subunit alcohol dehydrogenase family)
MTENSHKRPVAVIMGAGGMGLAVARRLGQDHRILLVDINHKRAAQGVAELTASGIDALACSCDVTVQASVQTLAQKITGLGGWNALAHVVGLSPSMGSFEQILNVNLLGAQYVCDELLHAARPGAAAVCISSIAGHSAQADEQLRAMLAAPRVEGWLASMVQALGEAATPERAYQLSKLGLIMMCQREAAHYARHRARLVSLSPGLIDTPMGRREQVKQLRRADLAAQIPLGREGTMAEIADVVAFLVSPAAAYVTGVDLIVDGGLTGFVAR